MPYGLANRQRAIAAFSAKDAERLPAYDAALERAASLLRELALKTPPNAGGGMLELIGGAALGRRLLGLSLADKRLLLDLFTKSAADFLDGWFESEVVKGALRLRRHRRRLCQPVHAGHGLRAAASLLRRGQRQDAACGAMPSAAWARSRRPWRDAAQAQGRRHPHRRAGRRVARRGRQGRAACGSRPASALPRAPWPPTCRPKLLFRDLVPAGAVEPELQRRFIGPQVRLRHVPHERRAVGAAGLPLPARQGPRRTITAPASSSARRSTISTAPISMRARTAGRASRWSRC